MTKDSHELDFSFIRDSAAIKTRVGVKTDQHLNKELKTSNRTQCHGILSAVHSGNIHVGINLPDADLIDNPANKG